MKPIPYLVILLLLLGCKKNSKRWTEITIRVNNYITGEPIDDVTCGVGYYKSHTLKPDEWVFLDVGSPVNGVYHYEFKAPKAISYGEFSYDPSKYYPVDVLSTIYYDYGVNEYQMYLVPFGSLRNTYKNVNCFDENDELIFKNKRNIDIPNFEFSGDLILTGCDIDIINSYSSVPVGRYEYKYSVIKNGVISDYIDTIEVKKNEYFSIDIEY